MFLTYLAKKYGVAQRAKDRSVFYPVRHRHANLFYGPPEFVKAKLTKETRTVHLWRSILNREARSSPPRGSYLEAICRRHDADAPIGAGSREPAARASQPLYGVAGTAA
jgi:Alpha 1,4-glycosyltransferase conserved region